MKRKILFVGQAPSRSNGHGRAFDGPSGDRLAKLLGIDRREFLARHDTANLYRRWPGKHGGSLPYRAKGDRFPKGKKARAQAKRLGVHAMQNPFVVFCGRRVADAFGYRKPFLTTEELGAFTVLVLPHPSGVNVWWNDEDNARRARRKLRAFCREFRRHHDRP